MFLVDLDHTFIGDLSITLKSPAGPTLTLWNQVCGNAPQEINFIYDDEGTPITLCNQLVSRW